MVRVQWFPSLVFDGHHLPKVSVDGLPAWISGYRRWISGWKQTEKSTIFLQKKSHNICFNTAVLLLIAAPASKKSDSHECVRETEVE